MIPMKLRLRWWLILLGVAASVEVRAQGTAFNYQGRLNDSGAVANGSYDFRFVVYNASSGVSALSGAITNYSVPVSNGLFSVTLDFGPGVFTGVSAWLDLSVRTNGASSFTALTPRQQVLAEPYAIFSGSASNLVGTLATAQLTGTLSSTQLAGTYSSAVAYTNAANTFAGNGAGLTALSGSAIATGTIADARLTANVALLNTNQIFTGSNIFTGNNTFTGTNQFSGPNNFTNLLGNNFSGSFFGNGLVGWVVVATNAVTAAIDHGYLLTSPEFTTVTLPTNANVVDIVRISGAGAGGWRVVGTTNQSFIGNYSSYHNSLWIQATTANNWRSVAASADGQLMYAANDGGLNHSTDSGHTWLGVYTTPFASGSCYGVATSADGTKVYAAVPSKALQVSTNAGVSWTNNASTTASNCVSVACSADGNRVVVITSAKNVFTSTNAGNTWSSISGSAWSAVACSGDGGSFFAASTGGAVYSSVKGGNTTIGGSPNLTGLVASTDGSKLFACASPGYIYYSSNSGTNWTTNAVASTAWNCLAASADCSRVIAAVNGGQIYSSVNQGANWSVMNSSTNLAWSALAASDDGTRLAAAVLNASGGIYYASPTSPSVTGTNSFITGSQGSAVELQYIGNNQFMPVSSTGSIWAN
jgi:photosystem II stability/assembly factor-like uncharacterized protein